MFNIKQPDIKKVAEFLKSNGTLDITNKHMKFSKNALSIKHRYFALMVSHCVALWRDDDIEAQKISAQIDKLNSLVDEQTKQEFNDACKFIAICFSKHVK